MKKLILSVVFALAMLFVSANIYADEVPDPCVPDCQNDPFVEPPSVIYAKVPSCSNSTDSCVIKIWFTWRIACNIWQDLQILKIQTLTDTTNGFTCSGCPDEALFKAAIASAIQMNPMNFKPNLPNNPGCYTIWRVGAASCWTKWDVWNPEFQDWETIYYPCIGGCCLSPTTVCRDSNNVVTITTNGPMIGGSFSCYNATPPDGDFFPAGLNCTGVCNWLVFDDYTVSKTSTDTEYDYMNSTSELKVIYNQFNESISIDIFHEAKAEITLEIVDINGNFVLSKDEYIQNGQNHFEYPLNNLASGAYFYKFIIEGMEIYTGKFNVVK